ncbi:MAG TPA: HAD family hydrolase [Catenuloplanes sp.]|jgi:putative hydrolase of the HAD superfamily
MSAYRAVLFDFFGTLTCSIQRGPQHAAVASILGCDPGAFVAVLNRSFNARARGMFGSAESTLHWASEQAGGQPGRVQLRAAAAARVEAVLADTRLRPDAVATLQAVRRRGLRTAVVSDCAYELPAFLPRLPIAPLIDARIFSVEIGRCKPEAAMYLAACWELGVEPRDCLYVGDGGSRELTGAAQVGMTAVRLAAADLSDHLVFDQDLAWCGPTIDSLTEVLGLLDGVPVLV